MHIYKNHIINIFGLRTINEFYSQISDGEKIFQNGGGVLFRHGFENIRGSSFQVNEFEKKLVGEIQNFTVNLDQLISKNITRKEHLFDANQPGKTRKKVLKRLKIDFIGCCIIEWGE